jgi:opacity protein-like surface antigen
MKLRSLLAVALVAPVAALAAQPTGSKPASKPAASAPAKSSPAPAPAAASPLGGLEVGGFVGYETDDASGLSLRADAELPFRRLAPQLKLSWVGSIGYSYLTEDISFGSFSANVLKFIPAARFTVPLSPEFDVFGDAGLGFYYAWWKTETNVPFFGNVSSTDSTFNLMMRLGVGAWYHVNPQIKVGVLFEFDPYFGDFDQNTLLVQAGAMFRL